MRAVSARLATQYSQRMMNSAAARKNDFQAATSSAASGDVGG
jgi:hypothetical protein